MEEVLSAKARVIEIVIGDVWEVVDGGDWGDGVMRDDKWVLCLFCNDGGRCRRLVTLLESLLVCIVAM